LCSYWFCSVWSWLVSIESHLIPLFSCCYHWPTTTIRRRTRPGRSCSGSYLQIVRTDPLSSAALLGSNGCRFANSVRICHKLVCPSDTPVLIHHWSERPAESVKALVDRLDVGHRCMVDQVVGVLDQVFVGQHCLHWSLVFVHSFLPLSQCESCGSAMSMSHRVHMPSTTS
jgi:hypothetical protein